MVVALRYMKLVMNSGMVSRKLEKLIFELMLEDHLHVQVISSLWCWISQLGPDG
jgi:hypothetical protein